LGAVRETAAVVQRAWQSFWEGRGDRDRNWLVEFYLPDVRRVSRSFPNVRAHDREDLVSVGHIALIKAVGDYNPEGMEWSRFLSCKLRYAMIDYIRKVSWVPKGIREVADRVEKAEEAVYNAKGREGTPEEVADVLGVTADQYDDMARSFRSTDWTVSSLDHCSETESPWVESIIDPAAEDPGRAAIRREEIDRLEFILQRLPGRDRQVIQWAHFEFPRVEQRDIAVRLGVHESRVSQILKMALEKARKLRDQPCLFAGEVYADNRMTKRD
jgi:RNA polymerase sigma factor for flagellar operon FliA